MERHPMQMKIVIKTKNFRKFAFPVARRMRFGIIPGPWHLAGRPRQFFYSANDHDIKHAVFYQEEHPLEMELDEDVSDIAPPTIH